MYTIFCRWCGASGAVRFGRDARSRQRYRCAACHRTFSRRTRTYQSGSHLSEQDWQWAKRIFASRGGMSGSDLARVLGYGRRTGQRLNRIFRRATQCCVLPCLSGCTEWDEAIFNRQWVLGGVSRATQQCLLQTVPNRTAATLVPAVERATDPESCILTDEHWGYEGLVNHWTVCHRREFVRRGARFVHTNTQEGIWGHLKELSRHVYRGFPQASLPQFLSEFMFRYNCRCYRTRVAVLSALLSRPKINTLVA